MPEIKHAFNQGKMNKDDDERLVPNGQYRDAINIQVSTSEGSDVGTVQNILGNTNLFSINQLAPNSKCVGTVADEKNDCFYWLVYHSTKNLILKYKNNTISFIFVDTTGVLEFSNNIITGVNILDNFLFWTDSQNEPKKIDVNLCFLGTNQNGSYHTKLVVPKRNIDINGGAIMQKEHLTVIKKSPKSKIIIDPVYDVEITSKANFDFNNGTLMENGEQGVISFTNVLPNESFYSEGDVVLMLRETSVDSLPTTSEVRIKILEDISGGANPNYTYAFEVLTISLGTSTAPIVYNCVREAAEKIFQRKFVRFGYRYRYNGGEYSPFSSFTDPIFKPGNFEYNSLKAYNTGMENNLVSLKIRNFISKETPLDVVQVDILYTESNSPTIYIVDSIKYKDPPTVWRGFTLADKEKVNNWTANLYEITSDLIYAAVPANQLLRPWDNVPKKALAQEITGNRIVYANYTQNYDLETKPILRGDYVSRYTNNETFKIKYRGNVTAAVEAQKQKIVLGDGQRSLKSIRDYQIGITYLDEFNRETPIFTSNESQFKIPKRHGAYKTKIQGKVLTNPPSWAHSFKAYVKETSTEYYNLAMSRVYRAEDGNLWLAFPSSERNKIDEETFLILKKAVDSNSLIENEARYKVLAIENEAPDFIKTEVNPIAEISCGTTVGANNADLVFGPNGPTVDSRFFDIDTITYDASNSEPLDEVQEDLYIAFKDADNNYTSRYEVEAANENSGNYNIVTAEPFSVADADVVYPGYPETTNLGALNMVPTLNLIVYKGKVVNRPQFKGMFFVKINSDSTTEENIISKDSGSISYEVTTNLFAHYLSDTAALPSGQTGTTQNSNFNTGGSTTIGRTNSKEEWLAILDFGSTSNQLFANSTTSDPIGGFFIDEAYYAGIHPEGSAGNNDTSNPNHVRFTDNTDSGVFRAGRGVYKENGEWFMELSYSKIGKTASVGEGVDNNYGLDVSDWNKAENWQPSNNEKALEDYAENYGGADNELRKIIGKIAKGSRFRVKNDDTPDNIFTIKNVSLVKRYNHTNYSNAVNAHATYLFNASTNNNAYDVYLKPTWKNFGRSHNRRITFVINLGEKNISEVTVGGGTNILSSAGSSSAISLQFLDEKSSDNSKQIISKNPAIWETEPKETADLDIYYEASEVLPLNINSRNNETFIPIGSVVTCPARPSTMNPFSVTYVNKWLNNKIYFNQEIDISSYQGLPGAPPVRLIFTRPDDSYTTLYINAGAYLFGDGAKYTVETNVSKNPFALSWFNCYSFNNGVESNRLRDGFNQVIISKGVKASSVTEDAYEEEVRKSGLIYSGIYNSSSGVNNLNQFIAAEKITKDLNPTYGSIQKLFQRRINLVAFCEDKVIKIMAGKDTLFNADGNPNVISTNRVLGDAQPFVGNFGISKNPESFVKESYRAYFTDKQRGAVLRLSMDGIEPISEFGMSNYFKNNLKLNTTLIGSYDDRKGEYNVTMPFQNTTVSYKENSKGWVSFKSFAPEQGLSLANDYYTLKNGLPYKHHVELFDNNNEEINRNTFYNEYTPSSFKVLLNDQPSIIKSFKTLGYEGSQSKVNVETSRVETGYYNLNNLEGWYVDLIKTDINGSNEQEGSVSEFIEKEGKWFNYIKGKELLQTTELKTDEFSFQGIGRASVIDFDPALFPVVNGCMDQSAINYDSLATVDNGSCTYTPVPTVSIVPGCMDASASNYDPNATYDNGSCFVPPGTGIFVIYGCTDPLALNYDSNANTDDGSCTYTNQPVPGCTQINASNYDPNANVDDGSCVFLGCTDPQALNYNPFAQTDDGSCTYVGQQVPGCTDPTALNYNSNATIDDGSCTYGPTGNTPYTLTVQDINDDD